MIFRFSWPNDDVLAYSIKVYHKKRIIFYKVDDRCKSQTKLFSLYQTFLFISFIFLIPGFSEGISVTFKIPPDRELSTSSISDSRYILSSFWRTNESTDRSTRKNPLKGESRSDTTWHSMLMEKTVMMHMTSSIR